jgi:CHAT domain-containing protein/Flp pilus assembly protein TadD
MKCAVRKLLLLSFIYVLLLSINPERIHAQAPSLHDSLRSLLTYFQGSIKDQQLLEVIANIKELYKQNNIDDSVARELLQVESLMKKMKIKSAHFYSFAKLLPELLKDLDAKECNGDYANSLVNLALIYSDELGQNKTARSLLDEALVIHKEIFEKDTTALLSRESYSNTLKHLAYVYVDLGEYEKALRLYEQQSVITNYSHDENSCEQGEVLNSIAYLHYYLGNYNKALPLLENALLFTKKCGDESINFAQSLNNLALYYDCMGKYDKALELFVQELTIRRDKLQKEVWGLANNLNGLGSLYFRMGDYQKSIPLFKEELDILKYAVGQDRADYAYALIDLSTSYFKLGAYEKALPLCQQALTIEKNVLGEKHSNYAFNLDLLANIYSSLGSYYQAVPLFKKAIAIRKETLGETHFRYAASLDNLALLYANTGRYEKALALYKQVLNIRRKSLNIKHPFFATSLDNLAMIYFAMGRFKTATALCNQAIKIQSKVVGPEHPDYANSLSQLGAIKAATRNYNDAILLYKKAISIQQKALGDDANIISNLNEFGFLYAINKNPTKAVTYFTRASNILLNHLAHTYTTLAEEEKMNFLARMAGQLDFIPSFLYANPTAPSSLLCQAYNNQLVVKGMVLEDQKGVLSNIRKNGDSSIQHIYDQWHFNKTFLGKQQLLPVKQRVNYFDSLKEVTTQLEQELSRKSIAFNKQQINRTITVKTVAEKLRPDEVAIEFVKFNLHSSYNTGSTMYAGLLLLPGDSVPQFISLCEEKQLQRSLKSSDALYKLVWKPLEKYLLHANTVYYAPVGLLHRVAFQALSMDSTHFLIDKYHLRQVLSTRSVASPSQISSKPMVALLWGNIDYSLKNSTAVAQNLSGESAMDTSAASFNFYTSDTRSYRRGEWSALPETQNEIDSVSGLLRSSGINLGTVNGPVATEEAFKALDGKSPQVLHLATHGFFLPVANLENKGNNSNIANTFTAQQNPMFRSGLVLAGGNHAWKGEAAKPKSEDGILTAYEIAQMDLSNTDLLVLSACETALGDIKGNEGVIGLQRAFKIAGVKQLIMSLWKVPDKETMELMTRFYKNWLGGQSTREALRSAQLEMRKKYAPYYWAAFVLVE